MRVFLAIFPDSATSTYLRDVMRLLDKQKRNLRSIPLEHQHLTVRFLGGHVSDLSKNAIVADLRSISHELPQPSIQITKLQFGFKRQIAPRVLFAKVAADENLILLQQIIASRLKALGFDDVIKWKPHTENNHHISIARLKPNASRGLGKQVRNLVDTIEIDRPAPFLATKLCVVQSVLDSRRMPTYRILEEIKLGK